VLLDESLPHELAPELTGHEVQTVQGRGWAGATNGALLRLAVSEFDAFVTGDRNLPYQQNLSSFDIRIIVVTGRRNRIEDIRPLVPRILQAIDSAPPGRATWVSA